MNCNRIDLKRIDCEVIETSFFKKEREEIKQVKSTYLELVGTSNLNDSVHQIHTNIILVGANKKVNLCANCSKKNLQIDIFIKNPKSKTLNLQLYDEKIVFYFGIFILFSSAVTSYIAGKLPIQCTFNRNTNRFCFKYLFLFRHNKEYFIHEIKEVVTVESNVYYVSTIIIKSNKKFVLCMSKSKNEADSFTHSINQFIGIKS